FTQNGRAIFDTGSPSTVISVNDLNADFRQHLTPSRLVRINGIGGSTTVVGEFTATVKVGTLTLPTLKFIVVDAKVPCLIGLRLVRDTLINGWSVDNVKKVIAFHLKTGATCKAKFADVPKSALKSIIHHSSTAIVPEPEDKLSKVKSKWQIDLSHIPEATEADAMADLLLKFGDQLFGDESNMGCLKGVTAPIHTEGESVSIPTRKMNPKYAELCKAEIERMKKLGVIEPCPDNKGWNSPLQPVEKDDGRVRICVDFSRTLNLRLTRVEPYPQPSVDEVLNEIPANAKYFSNVDLLHGYWQIEIAEEDRHKTAFWFGEENLQFARLPMGLKSSGNIFSRHVGKALGGVELDENIFKYLDDVSVITEDFESHMKSLEKLFIALIEHGLKLKPSKCCFLNSTSGVKFLGRKVGPQGIGLDPSYAAGVDMMTAPRNKKELESLIGRCVWAKSFLGARFGEPVKSINFSSLMEPLFAVKRQSEYSWTPAAEKSLQRIKKRLCTAPVMGFADFKKPFLLVTDASDVAAAGVLMQKQDTGYVIIAHCSHLFSSTERNWSTMERELFSIVHSCRKLDYFLRCNPFVINTDHKPLIYIDKTNFKASPKVRRWQQELSKYSFVIEHISGSSNIFADWLSRPFVDAPKVELSKPEIAGQFCTVENSKLVVYIPSWVVPDSCKGKTEGSLKFQGPMEDYTFFTGPEDRLSTAFASFLCQSDVDQKSGALRKFLSFADAQLADFACAKIISILESTDKCSKIEKIKKLATSDEDFLQSLVSNAEKLQLDFGTRLLLINFGDKLKVVVPPAKVAEMINAAHSVHLGGERTRKLLEQWWWPGKSRDIDEFVRSCEACARRKGTYSLKKPKAGAILKGTAEFEIIYLDYIHMPAVRGFQYCMTLQDSFSRWIEIFPSRTNTAKDTVRFLDSFIQKFGRVPDQISSDRGTHFTGAIVSKWCQEMGVTQRLHCPYRPQSSGSIERAHRTIKNSLFCAAFENRNTWLDNVSLVQSVLNACPSKATGKSPFMAVFGRPYEMPKLPAVPKSVQNSFFKSCSSSIGERRKIIHNAIKKLNTAADEIAIQKANNRNYDQSELAPNTEVLVFREQSVEAKRSHMPWIGPFKVVKANELTAKLLDPKTGQMDYVSRHHIRKLTPRPAHLEIYDSDSESEVELDQVHSRGGKRLSETSSVKSGPGTASKKRIRSPNQLRKPDGPAKKKKPVRSPDPISAPPPRRSTRKRNQTAQLSVDPSRKSYGSK
ncbi:MAG: hypothetical protein CMO47_00670, partial [Verrucomicrobiales bacterium]|nr:hypothetical protein [Verrucomicrobiales bacterium]